MYEFIRLQYIMGMIDDEKVTSFVPKWITKEQSEEIIKKEK